MKFMLRATASAAVLALAFAGSLAAGEAAAQQSDSGAGAGNTAPAANGAAIAPKTSDAADRQATNVDELIVTAQKREQKLQDVPVVVTSLNAQALQNAGIHDIKDLQVLTPGLTVTSTSNETVTTARIRGVGTVGDNPGLESSVGVVVDGVYRPRNGVGFNDLGEMERIEVLKGPQGTLFGTNTSAGVINIITKGPSFTPGVDAEATAGNYGAYGGGISITGPITGDTLAGRLYFGGRHRDGFYDVITGGGPRTDDTDQDQDFWTARGQLLWQPNSDLSVRLIADYTDRNENCCVAVQTRTGPTAPIVDALSPDSGVAQPADPFARTAYSNRDTTQKIKDRGISAEINYNVPGTDATLTSITAYRRWSTISGQDSDFTSADLVYRPADDSNLVQFNDFSQELRFAGKTDRIDYLFGGFYSNEKLKRNDSILEGAAYEPFISLLALEGVAGLAQRIGTTPPSDAGGALFLSEASGIPFGSNFPEDQGYADHYRQNGNSYSIFTNDTFHVTDKLEITGGLRYTWENKSLDTDYHSVGNLAGCGALLANPNNVAAALIARGVNPAIFGPGDPRGPALVQTAIGTICLPIVDPLFNGLSTTQKQDEHELTGTAKLVYHFSPDLMTYASYARGYKAGGFNLDRTTSSNGLQSGDLGVVPVPNTSFPAEFNDSYEVGFKSTLFNRSLLFNATLFYQRYTDFQLNTFLGTEFIVDAIPRLTSKGVDADLYWFTPVQGLNFQGGLTYADTRYGNFTADELDSPSRFPDLSLLPGNRVSFAPKWSLSGSVNYEHPIEERFRLLANLSVKYNSSYNTGSDLSPFKEQKGYALVNGRLGIGDAKGLWTLEVWAQNLFNQDYYQVVFNAPFQGQFIPTGLSSYNPANDSNTYDAFLGAPRTFGATLRVRWGGGQ